MKSLLLAMYSVAAALGGNLAHGIEIKLYPTGPAEDSASCASWMAADPACA